MPLSVSERAGAIRTFLTMEMAARADALSSLPPEAIPFQYPHLIHLDLGQPSTPPPKEVTSSLLSPNCPTGYTPALGLASLRKAISKHYMDWYKTDVPYEDIAVTTGASGGFLAAFTACFDAGDRVAMAVPGYPCYRHTLLGLSVEVVDIVVDRETAYQPILDKLEQLLPLDGLVVANPSNPCGGVLGKKDLENLVDFCEQHRIRLIVDEIYHGIGELPATVANYEDVVIINSFSKYWCLTGFRVGWVMTRDKPLMSAIDRILQNFAICPPSPSQHAAEVALSLPDTELRKHVERYRGNQKIIVEGLGSCGFEADMPEGAFYVWANCEKVCKRMGFKGSIELCERLMCRYGVALTPGVDYDRKRGNQWVRISCPGKREDIEDAVSRIRDMCEDGA